jgi:hypothetical protein
MSRKEMIGNDVWCIPAFVLRDWRKPQNPQFRIGLIISQTGSRSRRRHHHLLQELSLLARLVLKHQEVQPSSCSSWITSSYLLIIKKLLFLMVSSVEVPANFSSFRALVFPTSSSLLITLFHFSFPCPTEYNLLHTQKTHFCCFQSSLICSSKSSCFIVIHHAWEFHGFIEF